MALYHTYRPTNFDQVIGQDHITTTLRNLIKRDSISHAYLFFGPRGTGKTTVARVFAKAVNCETGEPCNTCASCQIFNKGSLDLIEIDAASNTGVDMVRQVIRERAHFLPNEATYKVYIIDEAHMLSKQANNALLKIIEEPPPHVIFILVTTEEWKIIDTVKSRCQQHQFRKISYEKVAELLKHICLCEHTDFEDEAIDLIAGRTEGCARDAVSLLDQLSVYDVITKSRVAEILGLSNKEYTTNLAQHIKSGENGKVLDVIHTAFEHGVDPRNFVDSTVKYFHSVLLADCGFAPFGYVDLGLSSGLAVDVIEALLQAKKDFGYIDPETAIGMRLAGVGGKIIIDEAAKMREVPIIKNLLPIEKPDPLKDPAILELIAMGGEVIFPP